MLHTGQPFPGQHPYHRWVLRAPATLIQAGGSTGCSGVCAGRQAGLKHSFLQLLLAILPQHSVVEVGCCPLTVLYCRAGISYLNMGSVQGEGSNFFPLEQGRQTWRALPAGSSVPDPSARETCVSGFSHFLRALSLSQVCSAAAYCSSSQVRTSRCGKTNCTAESR